MVFFKKPEMKTVSRFIENQRDAFLSYTEINKTRQNLPVKNFNNDFQKVAVGKGKTDFELAKSALKNWAHFPNHWAEIKPEQASTVPGTNLCLCIRLFGMWWLNACRIVYQTDEVQKFGFAYGTLPAHIESGEELFQVEIDDNDVVWYEIRAFSKPRHWLVRFAKPVVRLLQEKFRRDSADAVRRFIADKGQNISKKTWRPDTWLLALAATILLSLLVFPATIFHHDYGKPVLIFATLLSTPLALHLLAFHNFLSPKAEKLLPLLFPAGFTAALSQCIDFQIIAALLTVPWLILSSAFLIAQKIRAGNAVQFAISASCIFWWIAAAWVFAYPAGIRPFGFSDEITRLTAIHFHFAGLALPILAGLAQHFSPSTFGKYTIWMAAAGVPITALGISYTQLGKGIEVEIFAGIFMALAGIFTAIRLLQIAAKHSSLWLLFSGVVLTFTMLLAAFYALRFIFPVEFLSINWMRAVHGSLNAFIAIPCGLIGFAIWKHKK